jgi:hypothetical protein
MKNKTKTLDDLNLIHEDIKKKIAEYNHLSKELDQEIRLGLISGFNDCGLVIDQEGVFAPGANLIVYPPDNDGWYPSCSYE